MWSKKGSALEAQFTELYDNYADSLFRYCLFKTSSREQAMDLTQQSFLKTWEQMKLGLKIKNPKAFLYRVANNLIIDWYRSRKASSLDEMTEEIGLEIIDESEDTSLLAEKEQALKFLNKLETPNREIIIMRYLEDLSVKEMAEILGETENNVSVRLHRALKKLREILNTTHHGR